MNKISISAQTDFLERLSAATPLKAIAELIWNGFDAHADKVIIRLEKNPLDGIEKIQVIDNGDGIDHSEVELVFGNLGDSWKKAKQRHKGRALHGKNGQGRFKAFALGGRVEWDTVYERDGRRMHYQIIGRSDSLTSMGFTDPAPTSRSCGTEVVVTAIEASLGVLMRESARDELAKLFAAYLSQYPDITIEYDGVDIDPTVLQNEKRDIPLDQIQLQDGNVVRASVTIVEWMMPSRRMVHLCDGAGVSLHEIDAGQQIRAPGFDFTVYVKCDHLRELDKQGFLVLDDLHPDVGAILNPARKVVKEHFRRKLAERQGQIVQRWKQEQIYPFQDKANLTPIEEAERQVFDIIAVNVEAYLPAFGESDTKSKQFIFRLLAQALLQNPESVQKIITEVLKLKPKEQEDLADLLKKTSLQAIITSAKVVANRLNFLVGLENLIFDRETKTKLLERDQLHKILENEAWIFDEDFALSGSEERLEEVLEKHIGILGPRSDGEKTVIVGDNKTGRIDVMLSRVINPRSGEMDYLVVELKRPSKRIDDEVITQVKKYAMAVAGDERFRGVPAKWRFVAISNQLNDYAKQDSNQTGRPKGLVWASERGEVTVWVREWAEVINTARSRLDFVNANLSYEANRESAREYLTSVHARFIPECPSDADDTAETTPD